jgi:hypothetical protein
MATWITVDRGDWHYDSKEYALRAGMTWTAKDLSSLQNLIPLVARHWIGKYKYGSSVANKLLGELVILNHTYTQVRQLMNWGDIYRLYNENSKDANLTYQAAMIYYDQLAANKGMLNGVYITDVYPYDLDAEDGSTKGLFEWRHEKGYSNTIYSEAGDKKTNEAGEEETKTIHEIASEHDGILATQAAEAAEGETGSNTWMYLLGGGILLFLLVMKK